MRRYRTESDFQLIQEVAIAYFTQPEHVRRVNGLTLAVKMRLQQEGIVFPQEFTRNFEADAVALDNDIRRAVATMCRS